MPGGGQHKENGSEKLLPVMIWIHGMYLCKSINEEEMEWRGEDLEMDGLTGVVSVG